MILEKLSNVLNWDVRHLVRGRSGVTSTVLTAQPVLLHSDLTEKSIFASSLNAAFHCFLCFLADWIFIIQVYGVLCGFLSFYFVFSF